MKKASLCLVSLSWLFMLPGIGVACSCLPLDPKIPYKTYVLKRREKAAVVFAGKIPTLAHHLFDISIGKLVAVVPTDA